MDADALRDAVSDRAEIDRDAAERATEAVLTTLAERVTGGEAQDLAERLPADVSDPLELPSDSEAEEFGYEEFLSRVATRADTDEETARRYARAVFGALGEGDATAELRRAREQLPDEFDLVFEPGNPASPDEFLATVREATGEDVDAQETTTATLRSLGERVSRGEAEKLATYLPPEFRDPLVADAPGTPPDSSVDEFLARVADRTNTDEDAAEDRARAVTAALQESVADHELDAVRSQLPEEFDPLFDQPDATGGEPAAGE